MKRHLESDSSTCRVFNFRLNDAELWDGAGHRHPVVDLWFWEIFLLWVAPKCVDWLNSFLSRRLHMRYCEALCKEESEKNHD